MKITIDIPNAVLPSVEAWITKYFPDDFADRFDSKTGALLPAKPKWAADEYFTLQIESLIDRIVAEFPTAETAAQMAQIEALKEQVKSAHKVTRQVAK